MPQDSSTETSLVPGELDIPPLKRLPALLTREGFVDAFTIYGIYNSRFQYWARDLPLLPWRLQILFRVFLLGESVPVDALQAILPAADIEAFERLSIFHRDGNCVHCGHLVAIPINGYLIFTNRPTVDPIVYFGEDSAALAAHLSPPRGGDFLDLCSGPGVQALLISSHARRVVAVEINPAAAAFAHLNIVMNDAEQRIEVRTGDLYEAVRGIDFDFVVANPPLLPFPQDLPYPFVGHGGSDGLAITRRIIHGLPSALRPGGYCQIIGTCLGDASGPACETELTETARDLDLNIVMVVPSAQPLLPGSSMFDGMAWSCATASSRPLEEIRSRFEQHLLSLGTGHLYLFFLSISRAEGNSEFSMTRHYRQHCGFWFV